MVKEILSKFKLSKSKKAKAKLVLFRELLTGCEITDWQVYIYHSNRWELFTDFYYGLSDPLYWYTLDYIDEAVRKILDTFGTVDIYYTVAGHKYWAHVGTFDKHKHSPSYVADRILHVASHFDQLKTKPSILLP